MGDRAAFTNAAYTLSHATGPVWDLSVPFVTALGVAGAVVSTLGDPLGSELVSATDPIAARVGEIQLDLGEGPGWEALATHRPVLVVDLPHQLSATWPVAQQAFHDMNMGSIFAFPLVVADIDLGAITLYCEEPAALTGRQVTDASLLSTILARQVLRRALLAANRPEEETSGVDDAFSRREVHQATGMVLAQMSIPPDDALMVIRGHAFATGRPVRGVALDVIDRTLDFTPITD
jgi:hypothetical protein